MWATIKSISSLLLSFGLLLLGNGMTGRLLGLGARHEGFPIEITGIIMAGYFLGLFLGGSCLPFASSGPTAISELLPTSRQSRQWPY